MYPPYNDTVEIFAIIITVIQIVLYSYIISLHDVEKQMRIGNSEIYAKHTFFKHSLLFH